MVYQEPLWVGECHWCGSGGTYHKSRLGIKVTFLGGLPVASTVGWSGSVLRCHTWPPELSEVCHYSSCYPASGALLWQQRRELKTQWPSIYTAWIHRGLSSNFVFLENLQINFFLSYWENCLCTETLLSRDFLVRLGSPTVSREGEKGRRKTLCFTEEEHWKFMDSGR